MEEADDGCSAGPRALFGIIVFIIRRGLQVIRCSGRCWRDDDDGKRSVLC